jgi:hypothetical protein
MGAAAKWRFPTGEQVPPQLLGDYRKLSAPPLCPPVPMLGLLRGEDAAALLPARVGARLVRQWRAMAEEARLAHGNMAIDPLLPPPRPLLLGCWHPPLLAPARRRQARALTFAGDIWPRLSKQAKWQGRTLYTAGEGWSEAECAGAPTICGALRGSMRTEAAEVWEELAGTIAEGSANEEEEGMRPLIPVSSSSSSSSVRTLCTRSSASSSVQVTLFSLAPRSEAPTHTGQYARVNLHMCLLNCEEARASPSSLLLMRIWSRALPAREHDGRPRAQAALETRGGPAHGGQRVVYRPGELLAFDDGHLHGVENGGERPRVLLAIGVLHPATSREHRLGCGYGESASRVAVQRGSKGGKGGKGGKGEAYVKTTPAEGGDGGSKRHRQCLEPSCKRGRMPDGTSCYRVAGLLPPGCDVLQPDTFSGEEMRRRKDEL